MKAFLIHFKDLIKYKISIAVCFSSAVGYFFEKQTISSELFHIIAGVLILSSGASALNEVQEIETDKLMPRVKHRPLVSGKISVRAGIFTSAILIVSGVVELYITSGIIPSLIGFFTVVWYNIVYTNLKKITIYAAVPGALTGALPPMIGYTGAGGEIFDKQILFLALFFFIWQVPHFWLLILRYGEEYKKAGLMSMTSKYNENQLLVIISFWIISLAVFSIAFPLSGISNSLIVFATLILLSITLLLFVVIFIFNHSRKPAKLFVYLNAYFLMCVVALTIDKFLELY